jgi:hypothetical protein
MLTATLCVYLLLQYDLVTDRARGYTGIADYQRVEQMQYGEILHFVEFRWRGVGATGAEGDLLQVAIVQPWESESLLDGDMEGDLSQPPYKLVKEVSKLQVMEVTALRHVAGRVPIDGSNKHVVFETSLGSMIPDMV